MQYARHSEAFLTGMSVRKVCIGCQPGAPRDAPDSPQFFRSTARLFNSSTRILSATPSFTSKSDRFPVAVRSTSSPPDLNSKLSGLLLALPMKLMVRSTTLSATKGECPVGHDDYDRIHVTDQCLSHRDVSVSFWP
jgi:hypothetical protein